jgi:UDP-N-acetylmuramate--alanine ligase
MDFEPGTRVHVVGVGGAGMSGVARLLRERGCAVSGCDVVASRETDALANDGVEVAIGHDASHVAHAQVVLWSPAIAHDHPELAAARATGAELMSRATLLARLASASPTVGLTGTHGKTTATSMMAHVLHAARRDPARLVGASVVGLGANGHWGPDGLLLEVDESFGTFDELAPDALGLLNVEADHLDHYGTLDALEVAFTALVERTRETVVVWTDDPGARRVAAAARRDVVRVGRASDATWRVTEETWSRHGSSFELHGPGAELAIHLEVTGAHNVADAALVAVLALALGVAPNDVARGLAAFRGAPRRFQRLGSWRGVDVYEDYAHLPGEIAATLEALRAIGYQRITAVFQPHRVTRTRALGPQFAPAFDAAQHVVVTDIYRAGEANPDGVTGELVAVPLLERRGAGPVRYEATLERAAAVLDEWHEASDVVVLLGAGNVNELADRLAGGVS